MALLVMEQGPQPGKAFPLEADEVRLGRSPTNDIVLARPTVSRHHAVIRRGPDGYLIEDLQSTNGTYLNGEPVSRSPLREGDHIRIGEVVFRFAESAEAVAEAPLEVVSAKGTAETASVLERVGVEPYPVLAEEAPLSPTQARERLTLISQVSAELLQLLDPVELAERVAERLLEIFPKADQVLVALVEEEGAALTPQAVRRRAGRSAREVALSRTVLDLVTERREAVLCMDVQGDERFRDRPSVVGARIYSFLCVPLVCRDEFLGLIYLDSQRAGAPLEREDLLLATAVAGQVALAASNIRLHRAALARERLELDLGLAERLQRSFLPASTPEVPGMTFATYYTTAYEVGGDFYDFIPLAEGAEKQGGRWLVTIGDVSGKGIPAALMMARLTRDIRYHAGRHPPRRVLAELSRSVAAETEGRFFATLLCLEVHPEARRLVAASAGHCPPLVVPASAEPYYFREASGFPLGVLPEEPYQEAVLELAPGDCVLLYTDGLTEAMNAAGVIFGEQRLADAAAEAAARRGSPEPQQLIDEVLLVLRAFRGDAPPTDDLTMVALRWEPQGASG